MWLCSELSNHSQTTHLPSFKVPLIKPKWSLAVLVGFSWHFLSHILQQKPWSAESFQSIRGISLLKGISQEKGYKRISKALDIPVKTVIIKWRKYGATVILRSTGCPSKIDEKMRRKQVREAAKRPTATLKELQEFLARTGCVVHVTTISHIRHMSGLWGRVARKTSKPG